MSAASFNIFNKDNWVDLALKRERLDKEYPEIMKTYRTYSRNPYLEKFERKIHPEIELIDNYLRGIA
jgi:hypothetical protein